MGVAAGVVAGRSVEWVRDREVAGAAGRSQSAIRPGQLPAAGGRYWRAIRRGPEPPPPTLVITVERLGRHGPVRQRRTFRLNGVGVLTWRSTRSLPGSGWSSSRRAATASSPLRLVERVRASASSSHTISSGRDTLMLDMPRSWPLGYLASHRTSGVVAGCVYGCID